MLECFAEFGKGMVALEELRPEGRIFFQEGSRPRRENVLRDRKIESSLRVLSKTNLIYLRASTVFVSKGGVENREDVA